MNAPNPALPSRPLALKPKWIVTVAVLLVVYLLLRPWLVERFGLDLPGFTDVKPPLESTAPGTESTARAKRDQNRPIEVPVISEPSDPVIGEKSVTVQSETGEVTSSSKQKKPQLPADATVARTEKKTAPPSRPVETRPGRTATLSKPEKTSGVASEEGANTAKNTPKKPNTGRPTAETPPVEPEQPKLGVLKSTGRNSYESTAGLLHSQYRIDHVMEHGRDNTDKPSHGVFEGTQEEILALIDEAYLMAQKRGPPQVVIEDQGERTTYTVNMNRKIGREGGQSGARRRNPPLKMVKIVLEDKEVITAYPTNN